MSAERRAAPVAYWVVFAALLVLTGVTVAVAGVPLGRWHAPVALGIAAIKATLVVLIFMHALHSARLTWVVIGAAVFWLMLMIGLTLADYVTRPWATY